VDIVVTTPAGSSATSAADHFTYQSTPAVLAVHPNSARTPAATVVTITGSNFVGASRVSFGSVAATAVVVNSASSITATARQDSGNGRRQGDDAVGHQFSEPSDHFTYS